MEGRGGTCQPHSKETQKAPRGGAGRGSQVPCLAHPTPTQELSRPSAEGTWGPKCTGVSAPSHRTLKIGRRRCPSPQTTACPGAKKKSEPLNNSSQTQIDFPVKWAALCPFPRPPPCPGAGSKRLPRGGLAWTLHVSPPWRPQPVHPPLSWGNPKWGTPRAGGGLTMVLTALSTPSPGRPHSYSLDTEPELVFEPGF